MFTTRHLIYDLLVTKSISPEMVPPRMIRQVAVLSGHPVILISTGSGPVTPRSHDLTTASLAAMRAKATKAILNIFWFQVNLSCELNNWILMN